MAKLVQKEIELLKELLEQKMEEYKTIYNKLVEIGGMELPEDILDQVAGGIFPVYPTTPPAWEPTDFNQVSADNTPDRDLLE